MEGKGTRTAPYREDCWSEEETSALVDAWGDRYLLNRGSLRQQHWQEVADAVNSRAGERGLSRPLRTDAQCKNRIDTLKKKYKNEKARIAARGGGGGGDGGAGGWSFFSRLDALVGSPSGPPHRKNPPASPPLPSHRKGSSMRQASVREKKPAATGIAIAGPIFRRAAAAAATAAATSGANDLDDEEERNSFRSPSGSSFSKKKRRARRRARDELRELARAIESFAGLYQRVEEAKQQQRTELEKKRMEFTKELELQRMQIFVDSQLQLAKIKRVKPSEKDSYRLN